jgi:hypothetical protein
MVRSGIGAAIGAFSFMYYNDTEFLLSLASYLQRGEAKCFPMQTFKLLADLNPGAPDAAVREIFSMISTPGNALFTRGLAFIRYGGLSGVVCDDRRPVVHLRLSFMIRAKIHPLAAARAGLFAAFNPYSLSVEVLDRNQLSFMLSAVLFYTVQPFRKKICCTVGLWGLAAGVGLRFLH